MSAQSIIDWTPLETLRIADPDTHVRVKERISRSGVTPSARALTILAEETVNGLAQETGFGQAVADGLLYLIVQSSEEHMDSYVASVRETAETGVTLGRIMAAHLAPVLAADSGLADVFRRTMAVMRQKGTYTLKPPLELLSRLLRDGEQAAAAAYLDLLAAVFEQEISYNHSLRLVYQIPKAVADMDRRRRLFQIVQFRRIVRTSLQLVGPFLDGLAKGLRLLQQPALDRFVGEALKRYHRKTASGEKYLSLSSSAAKEACAGLQVAVSLSQVRGRLSRYVNARLGRGVAIVPIPAKNSLSGDVGCVYSDGRSLHLAEELDFFPTRSENMALYQYLVRLEAGCFEFGSFGFDLDRAADRHGAVRGQAGAAPPAADSLCDAQRFIQSFPLPELADDLLTLFEHGRILRQTRRHYPGLHGRILPLLHDEAGRLYGNGCSPMERLYTELVLDYRIGDSQQMPAGGLQRIPVLFNDAMTDEASIETCADLVCRTYGSVRRNCFSPSSVYRKMRTPFYRRFHWDRVSIALGASLRTAGQIRRRLAEKGVRLYRGDLVRLLERKEPVNPEQIRELIIRPQTPTDSSMSIDLSQLNLETLLQSAGIRADSPDKAHGPAFRYNEWHCHLQDYLHQHTRVQETELNPAADDAFYDKTLAGHRGAIVSIRRAFELLKPQGLVLLRQWPEGDAFDYRALLDFAVDRRAGRMPSDRLFIKRLKQVRDVAVLLLVDLSRSTANPVADRHATVLDVAKEALVLFCEALQVVGDNYAIAGFSGTGRHSVDYYRIKDFNQPLDAAVKGRIAALRPQRSTRMGAAIRHATAQLAKSESRVRFLLVISDGFPNDLDYKAAYAIADTRRAVQEARARSCHVKAITVNIGRDPRLDELYGRVHHHVIGDVRELPDKLLRLYGALTRY